MLIEFKYATIRLHNILSLCNTEINHQRENLALLIRFFICNVFTITFLYDIVTWDQYVLSFYQCPKDSKILIPEMHCIGGEIA